MAGYCPAVENRIVLERSWEQKGGPSRDRLYFKFQLFIKNINQSNLYKNIVVPTR